MQIIPAVDVLDGRVVRLTRGNYDAVTVYGSDPAAIALAFVGGGAELVHVVDLVAARDGEPTPGLWRSLAAAGVPFQVGGGIRSAGVANDAIAAGATRVVVGTAAVWDPAALAAILETVGSERVVAALDVRNGMATGSGWLDEGRSVDAVAAELLAAGVGRALVTGIVTDGTMAGPDLATMAAVKASAPGLAVIGSGGVGSLDDLRSLAGIGVEAAIVGRALYEGRFTLEEAVVAAASPGQARSGSD